VTARIGAPDADDLLDGPLRHSEASYAIDHHTKIAKREMLSLRPFPHRNAPHPAVGTPSLLSGTLDCTTLECHGAWGFSRSAPPPSACRIMVSDNVGTGSRGMSLSRQRTPAIETVSGTLCLLGGPAVIKNGRRLKIARRQQTATCLHDIEWWPSQPASMRPARYGR
jgi:hypothetical protein